MAGNANAQVGRTAALLLEVNATRASKPASTATLHLGQAPENHRTHIMVHVLELSAFENSDPRQLIMV